MRAAVLDHAPTCILAPYLQITQHICHSILLKSNADAICRAVDALHAGKKDISYPELYGRQPCDTGAQGIEQTGPIAQAQQKSGVKIQLDGARKLAVIVDLQANEDAASSDARKKRTLNASGISAANSASRSRMSPETGTKLQHFV
jgi:hypothetical protein